MDLFSQDSEKPWVVSFGYLPTAFNIQLLYHINLFEWQHVKLPHVEMSERNALNTCRHGNGLAIPTFIHLSCTHRLIDQALTSFLIRSGQACGHFPWPGGPLFYVYNSWVYNIIKPIHLWAFVIVYMLLK